MIPRSPGFCKGRSPDKGKDAPTKKCRVSRLAQFNRALARNADLQKMKTDY